MDPDERLDHRVPEPFGAHDAQVPAFASLGLVERLQPDGIGERRDGAPIVHRGLSALRLQLVEDLRELSDLLLAEVQLVGQEPERPPDSECAGAEVIAASAVPRPCLPTAAFARARALATAVP